MFIVIALSAIVLFSFGVILIRKSFLSLKQQASESAQAYQKIKAGSDALVQCELDLQGCKKKIEQDKIEYEKLKTELNQIRQSVQVKEDEAALKDRQVWKLDEELKIKEDELSAMQQKIQTLTDQITQLQNQAHNAASLSEQLNAKETSIQQLTIQLDHAIAANAKESSAFLGELAAKESRIQQLNSELQRITAGTKEYEAQIARLTELAAGIDALQRSLDEENRRTHEMNLSLQEDQMKLKLLNDKTKGSVEAIAEFAQGKEFDEFRKSIHMEEIIQNYEEQIKALRIEKLELQKKVKE